MSRTKHHGRKQKEKVFGDDWWWYRATPSWWTHMKMTKPQRRKVKLWERDTSKSIDVDGVVRPPHGNKPHQYFW